MPVISVIVPVYQVEEYLERCVDSILAQSFHNFELILVDDGSPDGSGAICDTYASKDSRVRVIHKENGGLSDARNAGIEIAQGKYLTFIDSDDYVRPDMLKALIEAINKYNTDISVCGLMGTTGELLPESKCGWQARIETPEQYYTRNSSIATSACGKLYRKSCFDNVRYPKGKLHEDAFVTYQVLFPCGQIAVMDDAGYACYTNPDSITRSSWHCGRLDLLEAIEQQINYFKQSGNQFMYRYMIREYVKCILWQQKAAEQTQNLLDREKGRKILYKKGRSALRKYWRDKVISGPEDMWIYSIFYPKLTKVYMFMCAVLKKWAGGS